VQMAILAEEFLSGLQPWQNRAHSGSLPEGNARE
jgi:hypothetical protein